MKRNFITNISMQEHKNKSIYEVDENDSLRYEKEVLFPISGVIAKTIKKQDKVKVLLIKTQHQNSFCDENEANLKQEILDINKDIGAEIEFKTIDIDYKMKNSSYNELFTKLIDELDENAELSVDVTFGPKPFMIILFNVLAYAEKFLGMDIAHIIYGKAEFIKSGKETVVTETKLCDLATLYYLNSIFNKVNSDKDHIKKFIAQLFKLDKEN